MHQSQRTRPATAEDFHRLADLAHQRALQLFRDGPRWYCTSASDPGACYFVTGFSCTCPGFVSHQRCTHYALLLERLGWLPELPELEPDMPYVEASPADCPMCCGGGIVVYRSFEEPCSTCNGTGRRQDRRLHDAPVILPVAAAA